MSYTNKTKNLELPQWLASDKPNWDIDTNEAFRKIDEFAGEVNSDMHEKENRLDGIDKELEQLRDRDNELQNGIEGNTLLIDEDRKRLTELESNQEKVNTDITNIMDDASSLEQRVDNAENSISGLSTSLEETNKKVDLNTSNISKVASSQAEIGRKVDLNSADIEAVKFLDFFGTPSTKDGNFEDIPAMITVNTSPYVIAPNNIITVSEVNDLVYVYDKLKRKLYGFNFQSGNFRYKVWNVSYNNIYNDFTISYAGENNFELSNATNAPLYGNAAKKIVDSISMIYNQKIYIFVYPTSTSYNVDIGLNGNDLKNLLNVVALVSAKMNTFTVHYGNINAEIAGVNLSIV